MKYVLAGDEDKVKLLTEKPAKLQEQANKALEKAKKMKGITWDCKIELALLWLGAPFVLLLMSCAMFALVSLTYQ